VDKFLHVALLALVIAVPFIVLLSSSREVCSVTSWSLFSTSGLQRSLAASQS
jgi:hypothetical protein